MLDPLLLLTVLAASPATTANRDQTEQLLREGRIISVVDVGQGITGSQKVELERGGRRLRTIFKAVDKSSKFDYRFGTESAPVYRDSYKHEIAAYELDKLLGLGLVPAVVERKIDGRRGSLQVWVERTLPIFVHGQLPPDRTHADDHVHTVRLFDYLIFNTDRHFRNLMFAEDWRPILIDHSLTFHLLEKPPRHLYRFPRSPIEKLERMDRRELKKVLGRYLKTDQLEALEERRQVVLELVATAIAERGRENALFEWPP